MSLALLSGATGNPINLKRMIAPQAARGIPAAEADFSDFRSNGGPFSVEPQEIERLLISTGGEPAGNLTGKMNLGGGPFQIGDVDPENMGYLNFLANLFGKYDYTDNTTWDEWIFSLQGATSSAEFLSIINDNDVTPRQRINDLMIGAMRFSAAPNENLAIEVDFGAAEFDLHGAITQESGTGSDLPQLKRLHNGNYTPDATLATLGDLYVEVVSGSANSWVINTKIGSGSAYSSTQTIDTTGGGWHRLVDEAGARIGLDPSAIAEQILIRFPDTPTLVASDEFKILGRRATWTPSLTVDQPISSVNTLFYLDGAEIKTEGGWNIEMAWETIESVADVAGRQGNTVQRSGDLIVTMTPIRRVVDMTLQAALMKASTVSVVVDAEADTEITAGQPYRNILILPECRVTGPGYGVEAGGENREETVILTARKPASTPFSYDGIDVNGHANVVVHNGVATL